MQPAVAGFQERGLYTAKTDDFVKSSSSRLHEMPRKAEKLISIILHSAAYRRGSLGAREVCTVSTLNTLSVRSELHKLRFPQKTAVCYCGLR